MTLAIVVALVIVIQIGICAVLYTVAGSVREHHDALTMLADILDVKFESDQKLRSRQEKLESDINHLAESSGQRLGNLENKVTLLEREARNGMGSD